MAHDWEAVDPDSVPLSLKPYVHTTPSDRVYVDQVLGYRDGVLDARAAYAKVAGKLMLRVKEADWVANQGQYMAKLKGAIGSQGRRLDNQVRGLRTMNSRS